MVENVDYNKISIKNQLFGRWVSEYVTFWYSAADWVSYRFSQLRVWVYWCLSNCLLEVWWGDCDDMSSYGFSLEMKRYIPLSHKEWPIPTQVTVECCWSTARNSTSAKTLTSALKLIQFWTFHRFAVRQKYYRGLIFQKGICYYLLNDRYVKYPRYFWFMWFQQKYIPSHKNMLRE